MRPEHFSEALRSDDHTLKRTLTDPRIFSGIGNAYSDEILFKARLPPTLTKKLTPEEWTVLPSGAVTFTQWTERCGRKPATSFLRESLRSATMRHWRYKQPCPRCGNAVQRIRYRSNETNYCLHCETEGGFWPTVRSRGFCARIGQGRRKNWR